MGRPGAARDDEEPTSSVPARALATNPGVQLALELPAELPRIALEPDWKTQQRLWGHSFHPMCSYLASFPAALAHAFIDRWSRPGDVVLDPFCGRGTVPLQACAEGRVGVGNDLNPLAHLLTAAKVEPAGPAETATRLTMLRLAWTRSADDWLARAASEPLPAEVAVAFHPRTLAQVLFLRASLDLGDRVDRFLAAATIGILHGKTPTYLSTLMPNGFSMAPRYVRDYAARTGFVPPERDAFALLEGKLRRLFRDPAPRTRGLALGGDARDAGRRATAELRAAGLPDRARLVIGSPPYLRVVRYGYYNWLRTWFLGLDAAAIDASLDAAHRGATYLTFLRDALRGLRPVLADDAVVVLVIGDVATDRGRPTTDGEALAEQVWAGAALPEGYRLAGVALDRVAAGRKLTGLWGDEAGRATTTDRILVMGASEAGRRRALAGASLPVDWTWPPRLRAL